MSKTAKCKLIKDVVHGYIEIEPEYIELIDTPEFQRLKNIRQTSYTALYPSSSHDRFSHSLGVFALGKYAFDHFMNNVIKDHKNCASSLGKDFWANTRKTFLSACLLHDVGHAPFSHTSEAFFKIAVTGNKQQIYHDLIEAVSDTAFSQDFSPLKQDGPKAHEIMSATIGIKLLDDYSVEIDKALFARMIIGIQYSAEVNFQQKIYNAIITLLNSDIIDVDRLDYIMRDSVMTGYKSVSIDVNRLLSSVCLVSIPNADNKYKLGFYKNAVSIIENVIIAHDFERRWIQNHSAIAYDTILIQHFIKEIDSSVTRKKPDDHDKDDTPPGYNGIFQQKALSATGMQIDNGGGFMHGHTIRLLCDSDILFLAKQLPEDNASREMIDEYFNRRLRKKAIWKTETDFSNLMRNLGDTKRDKFLYYMRKLFDILNNSKSNAEKADFVVINENSFNVIEDEYQKQIKETEEITDDRKSEFLEVKERRAAAIETFKSICDKCAIKFDLVIKQFKKFSSGTDNLDKGNIYIKYGKNNDGTPFTDLLDTYRLKTDNKINEERKALDCAYYVYYKREKTEVSPIRFINSLICCYEKNKKRLGTSN